MTQEIAKIEENTLPAELQDMLVEQGESDFGAGDLQVPFIGIVQKMSPAVDPDKPQYNPEARAGNLMNNNTYELYDGNEGILVVPVKFQNRYREFEIDTKGKRGDFVADHGTDRSLYDQAEKDGPRHVLPNGNEIEQSAFYYVLVVNQEDGTYDQAVINMSRTQYKKARGWNTLITTAKLKTPDGNTVSNLKPYAFTYRLKTATETNSDGESYSNWLISREKPTHEVNPDLLTVAKNLRELVESDKAKPQGQSPDDNASQSENQEEMPF